MGETAEREEARRPAVIPAATMLLVRDGVAGLEVFMVRRHHQIDFASGALVFPGGKTAPGDAAPGVRALCAGADGLDDQALTLRVAALRETFEESGVLLARAVGETALIDANRAAALASARAPLDRGERAIGDFLAAEGLHLALDALVPFAHWVTPKFMPKRFDTHFFIARTPPGQSAVHDGRESVDSVWIRPGDALASGSGFTVIFPTRMNLEKLARSATADAAMAAASSERIVTVEPWVEERPDGPVLRIPPDAGYGDVAEPLSSLR